MRFDELRKKFLGRGLLAALFIVAAAAALYGGGVLLKADADPTGVPDSVAKDPLDMLKNARLVPKQRLAITYRDNNWNINNFVFTDKDNDVMTTDMREPNQSQTLYASSMRANDSYNYVFASASTEGYISSEVTLSPDLCGDTAVMVRKNILVNSYLVRHDGGTNELYLSVREGDEMSEPIKIPDMVPAYSSSDGLEIALDKDTAHDIAAFDWNGDGYTDYAVTFYVTSGSELCARLLIIDGKSLYEKSKNSSAAVPKYYYIDGPNADGYKRSTSYRMTTGDFDGDGIIEVAVYSTGTRMLFSSAAVVGWLEVYKIEAGESGLNLSQIYTETTDNAQFGGFYEFSTFDYSGGLAAGDINGDGRDELVLFRPYGINVAIAQILMDVYQWQGGTFVKVKGETSSYTGLYAGQGLESSYPLNAIIADLDGDGLGELVWTYGLKIDGEDQLNMYIHDWNIQKGEVITNAGTVYKYNLHDFREMNWTLDPSYIHYSLCTGFFIFDPQTRRAQIAVGHMGGEGNVDVGVFSWSPSSNLQLEGKGWYTGVMMRGNMGPIVQAVDFYEESFVVGEPTVITVEDNIELYMVTQAPPKHWDRVRAAGSALSGYAEEDGKVTLDSFAVFDTDGYYTGMQLNGEWGSSSSETGTHGLKTGASLGLEISHKGSVVDEIFHRSENIANEDPMVDAGGQYGADRVKENTDEYATSMNYTFSYRADRDDQLYYRANDYSVCRYPIILPADKRFITVSDDAGVEYKAQNYFQFIVPTETASIFTPTPGRSISWYEPLHDNYNLFTYPKRLTDITGYPQGRDKKISINENDPLSDVNGEVFVTGSGNVIGNLDASEFHLDASTSSKHSDMKHVIQTGGAHAYYHPTIGKLIPRSREITVKVDIEGDYTWGTDSTTTTNASEMYGMTMAWPGARSYTMYTDNWSAADMQFKSDAAYFTQDDGAFCVGYAVPELESFQSRI